MLTITQKKTIEAIVNLFETGHVLGDYSMVTLIAGDTGHLTYGRSQTTLGSGNLHDLLQRYCTNPGAQFRTHLEPYLTRFSQRDVALDKDYKLHNILRAAADDPVMRDTQDAFFDDVYWKAAARTADRRGITVPLGIAVVYDSFVHGSWKRISDRTSELFGRIADIGEEAWITRYVSTRREWLGTHSRSDLRATVYRMDALQRLIDQGYWGLDLPLVVRNREISIATLGAMPPRCYDGPHPGSRALSLQSPMLCGADVRLMQVGLSSAGIDIKADGIFGRTSRRCLKAYQSTNHLPPTGAADPGLVAQLAEETNL